MCTMSEPGLYQTGKYIYIYFFLIDLIYVCIFSSSIFGFKGGYE